MSKKTLLLFAVAVLTAGNASAATTHLSEYNWDDPSGSSRSVAEMPVESSGAGENRNSCMQKCPGYSMTITECSAGYELKSCESANCGEYHKCEPNGCAPGYDMELKDCPIDVQEDNYMCSKCIEQ